MGKRVNVKEAAKITGLTEWSLRAGIKQGKYPYIKVGIGKGRIFVDIDLLEEALEQEAKDNMKKQAQLFEQYQREHNTEVVYMGSLLNKSRV